jgi:hypothetical protein
MAGLAVAAVVAHTVVAAASVAAPSLAPPPCRQWLAQRWHALHANLAGPKLKTHTLVCFSLSFHQ